MINQSNAGAVTERFAVRATADSHFSWLRTRLSLERTLMSWVRTAIALIGFGFTIVQFFSRMQQVPDGKGAYFPQAPYYFGLALILCGIAGLVISIWQYQWSLRYLWSEDFIPIAGAKQEGMQTPIMMLAVSLVIVGVFAFFAVVLHFV